MTTAIELSASSIRICQLRENVLTHLESYPIPRDSDPIVALQQAPLPQPLGPVRILLHHPDMLQQSIIQPPAPQDRLDRIIRFELMAIVPDMSSVLCSWQVAPVGGEGDLRILVNLAKRNLVEQLRAALKNHGGQLVALSLPACGMYQMWKSAYPSSLHTDEVLVDIGDTQSHVAIVRNGELIFIRTHKAGTNDIIDGIASLRNISYEDAIKLANRLTNQAPDDIQQLIRNNASGLASGITSVLRFASAQLKIAPITPQRVCIAGIGGRFPGLRQTLQDRLKCTTTLINPFTDLTTQIPLENIDLEAELPSPWTAVLGGARNTSIPLDTLQQLRQERMEFWGSHGALRAAAVTAVVIMILAFSRQFIAAHNAEGRQHTLANSSDGLVTIAEAQMQSLQNTADSIETERQRTQFLYDQLAPAKVAQEVLNGIASLNDPKTQRVQLTSYQLYRSENQLRMIIEGAAEESSGRRFGEVLDNYRQQLRDAYPLIIGISDLGSSIDDNNRMRFQWELRIAHVPQAAQAPAQQPQRPQSSRRGAR
ncbi:MAG: hypothetical protein EA401_02095 [Planctomycetota bacterium]|nr:MAG: hypothetical protein EA401_02095 [Planctomycetota bacterium]